MVDEEVFDFFNTAYTQGLSVDVTMSRELDDGTFDTFLVIIGKPQWRDETVGEDDKIYGDLTVQVVTA